MKKALNIFFVTLGVIFFILILLAGYFFITDPLNLKPLFFGGEETTMPTRVGEAPVTPSDTVPTPSTTSAQGNPALNASQAVALETFGIDPAALPSEITPEQEACFTAELGAERVAEIKAGATPTAGEIFAARGCL